MAKKISDRVAISKLPYVEKTLAKAQRGDAKKVTLKTDKRIPGAIAKMGKRTVMKAPTVDAAQKMRAGTRRLYQMSKRGSHTGDKTDSRQIARDRKMAGPKLTQAVRDLSYIDTEMPSVVRDPRPGVLGKVVLNDQRFIKLQRALGKGPLHRMLTAAGKGLLSAPALADEVAARSIRGAMQKTGSPGALTKKRQRTKA